MKEAPHNLPPAEASGERLTTIYLLDPPTSFYPAWPERNSHAGIALKLFLDGRVLGPGDYPLRGGFRAAALVAQLHMLGWPIATIEVRTPSTEEDPGHIELHYELPLEYATEAMERIAGLPRGVQPGRWFDRERRGATLSAAEWIAARVLFEGHR